MGKGNKRRKVVKAGKSQPVAASKEKDDKEEVVEAVEQVEKVAEEVVETEKQDVDEVAAEVSEHADEDPGEKVNEAIVVEDIVRDDEQKDPSSKDAPGFASDGKFVSDGKYRNKQRCLAICSRGVTARYRHLLEDLRTIIPHHKKESKLDAGDETLGRAVNDIATLRSCTSILFLECRKRQDCYMWLCKNGGETPGPSAKFLVTNTHTMDELRLTGNCLRGSRPLLSFDESFDRVDHLRLLRPLFIDIFGVPRGHPKSKPFVDRVMAFYYADERIWVRHYQILEQQPSSAKEAHEAKKEEGKAQSTSLVEIGPRFVLNPIRIFRGSFGGPTLYQNPSFIAPNAIRSLEKRKKGTAYVERKRQQQEAQERKENIVVPEDPLDSVFK